MYIIYNHIIRRFDFSFQNNQKRKIHFDTNSSKSLLKDTDISNDRPCFFRCGKFGNFSLRVVEAFSSESYDKGEREGHSSQMFTLLRMWNID